MEWLQGDLTTLTFCWRIVRRDGVAIGLTAHDRDLSVDGLVYRAAPGMTPSAITRSASLDAASMDVTGALTGEAVSETDLLAGRWDGAWVSVFAVDWSDPGETVALGVGAAHVEESTVPALLLAAADRAGGCTVAVRQAGSLGLSPPATVTLPPLGEGE